MRLLASALAVAWMARVEVKPELELKADVNFKANYAKEFWETECLGVLPPGDAPCVCPVQSVKTTLSSTAGRSKMNWRCCRITSSSRMVGYRSNTPL